MKNKGFTLTELLLVVAILSILAALAMPKLFPQTETARTAEAIGILAAMRQGQVSYYLERQQYLNPANAENILDSEWQALGLDNPNPSSKYFVYSFTADNVSNPKTFTATATRNSTSDPNNQYGGKKITLDKDGNWGGDHVFVPEN